VLDHRHSPMIAAEVQEVEPVGPAAAPPTSPSAVSVSRW